MGLYKGKRKRGLRLSIGPKPHIYRRQLLRHSGSTSCSPFKSPSSKRLRQDKTSQPLSSRISSIKRVTSNPQTPRSTIKRKKIYFSPNLNRSPATCSRRKLLYSTPKDVNFSDKELDSDFESDFKDIPTSESKENEHIDPECHMVNDAVECGESDFQIINDFLGEIDKVGHKATFMKFFSMVLNKQFPLDNVAFSLFTDVITWFSKDDSRGMRYSQPALKFFWLGKKLFGGRFVRFMSGLKNETDLLKGNTTLNPTDSKINFACPSEYVLTNLNPLGNDFPEIKSSGLINGMIELKSEKDYENSFVLMFDGKKIRKGTDVDLLGFEDGESLADKKTEHENDCELLAQATAIFKEAQSLFERLELTPGDYKERVFEQLTKCTTLFSKCIRNLRERKKSRDLQLLRLKEKSSKDTSGQVNYAYAIDMCKTLVYQIENCLFSLLDVQLTICKAGAFINKAGHLFAKDRTINLSKQSNVVLLKEPNEMKKQLQVEQLDPTLTKQRSTEWFAARNKAKVTGSSAYIALGCDSLKRQKEHFDHVVSGVDKQEPGSEQKAAMEHGSESEVHQIATLSSVIMPYLYPDMIFHEEGYYPCNGLIVSPDGSLRTDSGIVYAFEGKAPIGNAYKTPVHYEVPERYISQTILESDVEESQKGTLYLCWSNESTTLFEVPPGKEIADSIYKITDSLYHIQIPKRPSRISEDSRNLKEQLRSHVGKCIFIGEFPSVKGLLGHDSHTGTNMNADDTENVNTCHYDELLKAMLKGKTSVQECYELLRQHASQVVVYLLADLDRLWKPEQPHAVPVLYFYRGYSLPMKIVRKLTDYCKAECKKKGIDIVITCSDGEFLPLMVHDKDGNPLTMLQLSKKVWGDVCKLQKSDIVKRISSLNKTVISVETECGVELTGVEGNHVRTPMNGWSGSKKNSRGSPNTETDENVVVENDAVTDNRDVFTDDEILGAALESCSNQHVTQYQTSETPERNNDLDTDTTILYTVGTEYDISAQTSENAEIDSQGDRTTTQSTLSDTELHNILHLLQTGNRSKWETVNCEDLQSILRSAKTLNKLLKKELLEIIQYINLQLIKDNKQLMTKQKSKSDLVNQLSHYLGDGSEIERTVRKQVKLRSPKTLHEIALKSLMKKEFPKQVLNIAYATFLWPKKVKEWREKAFVSENVEVVGTGYFQPYYVPEFDIETEEFGLFSYDKTHLGTNFRKALCLNKVQGIQKKAWEVVADRNPKILHPSIIQVSDEGKILDQMKESLALNMVSAEVETEMERDGYVKEAELCNVLREGLFVADDQPGVTAKERCIKRLKLIQWLDKGVNFGNFPPYGSKIKGLSNILYEGLRVSLEAKLYLYALSKKGTYSARAPNTLCSESFFSSMQEMDPWGQGVLTGKGVQKHITDFTTITAMKMEPLENRYVYISDPKVYELRRENPCLRHVRGSITFNRHQCPRLQCLFRHV